VTPTVRRLRARPVAHRPPKVAADGTDRQRTYETQPAAAPGSDSPFMAMFDGSEASFLSLDRD